MLPRKLESEIPYHINTTDRTFLASIGICERLVPIMVTATTVQTEPVEATPTRILRCISDAPTSVGLQDLIEAFGEDVMPMLLTLMKGGLVKCWGPYFNKFYIIPESKDKVEQMLLESGD
jgi:hypothetical protein